jgi:hypothetical protein
LKGIRIHSKAGGDRNIIDYGFCELVTPIKSHLENLHWILSGMILDGSSNLEEFEGVLPRYEERELERHRIMTPAFLSECCKWIKGDWGQIYGVVDIRPFTEPNDFSELKLLQDSTIVFRCVDTAFWEVFSTKGDVVDVLRATFPHSSEASCPQPN